MICTNCGKETTGDFCSNCGTAVVPHSPDKKTNSVKWWILVIAIGFGFIVMLIVLPNPINNSTTTPTRSNLPAAERTGNKAHDLLMTLSEQQQMRILSQSFIDEPCVVNRIFYQGMSKDLTAFWSVGCTNGRSYQISIYADEKGTSKCLDCAILKYMTNVDCFVKFKDR